jgi:NitT/TauT family transport system substrate-binding protein
MLQVIVVAVLSVMTFARSGNAWAQGQASRLENSLLSYPAFSISLMPALIAQQKNFYQEEGLSVTLLQAPGTPGIQAMMAGQVDFSTNVGIALSAILRSVPFKIIMLNETTLFWLYSKPNITSLASLKGKTVGMSTQGSLTDINLSAVLEKNGLDPQRDVTKIVIRDSGTRIAALETGSLDAAVLPPPWTIRAKSLGFKPLVFFGNEIASVYTGMATTEKLIKERPDKVFRFVKASLKGLKYLKANRNESVTIMAKAIRIDEKLARDSYDDTIGAFFANGYRDDDYLSKAT